MVNFIFCYGLHLSEKNVLHELSKRFVLLPPWALWKVTALKSVTWPLEKAARLPTLVTRELWGFHRAMGLSPEQQSPLFCSTWTCSLTATHWCGCAFRLWSPAPPFPLGLYVAFFFLLVTAADWCEAWVSQHSWVISSSICCCAPHLPYLQHLSWAGVLLSVWDTAPGWWACLELRQARAKQGRKVMYLAHSCSGEWVQPFFPALITKPEIFVRSSGFRCKAIAKFVLEFCCFLDAVSIKVPPWTCTVLKCNQ